MAVVSQNLYPSLSGANHNFTVVNNDGTTITMNGVKDFRAQQDTLVRSNMDKNGVRWESEQPVGYSGSFTVVRRDVLIDDVFLDDENDWFTNQSLSFKSIFESITLPATGASTTYQYTYVTVKFDSLGEWDGTKDAEMRVSWKAQRRMKVSG
jgi:hypothetical protein